MEKEDSSTTDKFSRFLSMDLGLHLCSTFKTRCEFDYSKIYQGESNFTGQKQNPNK
jgi:hypothetical protein